MSDPLSERIKRIGLSRKAIAKGTGLVEETVGRTLNGATEPLRSTAESIETFVAAHERALLRHLIALHPAEAMAALCPERQP
jgi:hypothetical protein